MLPVILQAHVLKVGLAGAGEARARRAALLAEAGVAPRLLPPDAPQEALEGLQLLFVAGLAEGEARALAVRARALGALVNVEDVPTLCDFHVPAMVRRGDLLLTVSTGGHVPALSRALRQRLAQEFGPEWSGRLKDLGLARARWRAQGLAPADVSRRVRDRAAQEGWL